LGKEVIISISILFGVMFVMVFLLLSALLQPSVYEEIPTGSVSLSSTKDLRGTVEVRIERLRFPLSQNDMIISIKNLKNFVVKPIIKVKMEADIIIDRFEHCSITPDSFIYPLQPGQKQFVEVSLRGCTLHNRNSYDDLEMTVLVVNQAGKELGSASRRIGLRG